jgi:hypothetical protein
MKVYETSFEIPRPNSKDLFHRKLLHVVYSRINASTALLNTIALCPSQWFAGDAEVGLPVGPKLGERDGAPVGLNVGISEGATEGAEEGFSEGAMDGMYEGAAEGMGEGATEGETEGVWF